MILASASVPADVPIPSWWGVALSGVLVAIAGVLILRARLGLTRDLAVAVVRAAVQLTAVGYLLSLVFKHAGLPGALGWVTAMVLIAGRVGARRGRGLPRAQLMATLSVGLATAATLGLLVGAGVVSSRPLVVIPIGGMVVNAAMNATSVTMLRLRDEVQSSRHLVEARLALGLPSGTAFSPHARAALRTSLTPQIDSASTVGLIALPGAMTGLIIAGVSPEVAIRYQIIVVYLGLGAAAMAAVTVVTLGQRWLFDEAHRLRPLASGAP